jgi:hypothetical protein
VDNVAIVTSKVLKQGLLLAFIGVALLLIGLTWADNMRPSQSDTPSYYRRAPEPVITPVVPTTTPIAPTTTPIASATPTTTSVDEHDPISLG